MNRHYRSENYNWNFCTRTGYFERWGKTLEDDPQLSPIGPEILDIEISTICHGPGQPCPWCYKSNTAKGHNMSLETFKSIFDKLPNNLMQIAFGIGDIDSNPDLYDMFAYARGNGVIPNVTINGWRMSDYHYNMLGRLCGAVAVSHYDDEHCFNAIQELTSRGMEQVNIHKLLAKETLEECIALLGKAKTDPRLKKLNAIVFLLLKPKGVRNTFHSITNLDDYKLLAQTAIENGVVFGMDSCSAPLLLKATEGMGLFNVDSVEPCESTLFSLYINTDGDAYLCSFAEGLPDVKPVNVLRCDNFLDDVWFSKEFTKWRKKIIASSSKCNCSLSSNCRSCPIYPKISICKDTFCKQGV